jgi:glyoxylase-like metal-dependent hydrolase (beta-lactamase superfamily II)
MKFRNLHRMTAAAFAAATVFCLGAVADVAQAAAPMVKTSAPAFYRTMVGDFEVTALFDGVLSMSVDKFMTNTSPAQVKTLLAKESLGIPMDLSVNAFLVNTGSKLVLVDAGGGGSVGPALGALVANLKASGYQPEQIDEIYITHMHFDHVGGLAVDGKAVFPNAIVRADKHEADYWLSQDAMDKAPEDLKWYFKVAMTALRPYVESGRFKPFDGDTDLVPGVKALSRRGHTPGHTTYMVESKGQRLLLWGDLMHVAAIQFPHPEVTISSDTDSPAAAVERRQVFADAARQDYLIGAAHNSWPGLGHLHADGKGFRWAPINYSPVRNEKPATAAAQ